jgi:hypothetical protein
MNTIDFVCNYQKFYLTEGCFEMPRYIIEVPHDENTMACLEAIQTFLHSGSHFLMNADWGCLDDEHKAWISLDAESKDEALSIVPVAYRADTKVTRIAHFTKEKVQEMIDRHKS